MAHNNSFGNHRKKGGSNLFLVLFFIILVALIVCAIMIERSGDLPMEKISIQTQLSAK